MNIKIGSVVKSILSTYHCFPLIAEANTTFPYIVYKRSSTECINTKDFISGIYTATIDIIIASDSYKDSIDTANTVIQLLEHYNGTVNNIKVKDIIIINTSEDFSENTYLQNIQINIKYGNY